MRLGGALALAGVALAVLPGSALAGVASVDVRTITLGRSVEDLDVLNYKAPEGDPRRGPSEVNQVRVGLAGTTAYLSDTVGIQLGPGCLYASPRTLNHAVVCTLRKPIDPQFTKQPRFFLQLGNQNDVMAGATGAAVHVNAGTGADRVRGGPFDDVFSENRVADFGDGYRGLGGSDTIDYFLHRRRVSVSADGRRNDGAAGERDAIASDIERLNGSRHGATLIGNGGRNLLYGFGPNDVLRGGASGDRLVASSSSRAAISGGTGNDRIAGSPRTDRILPGPGRDAVASGGGNDRIRSRDGARDRIRCGRGSDRVRADVLDRLRSCELVDLP